MEAGDQEPSALFTVLDTAFERSGLPEAPLDPNNSWYSMALWEQFVAYLLERAGVIVEMASGMNVFKS